MEKDKYKGINPKLAKELAMFEMQYFRRGLPVPFCGMEIAPAKVKDYELFMDATACLTLDKNTTLEGIRMSNLDYLVSKLQIQEENEGAQWSFRLSNLIELCFGVKSGYYCPKCGKVYAFDSEEAKAMTAAAEERGRRFLEENLNRFQDTEEEAAKALEELKEAAAPRCPDDGEALKPTLTVRKDEAGKAELCVKGNVISSKEFDRLRQIVLFQNIPDYRDESWVDPSLKKDREERMEIERRQNDVHASVEDKVICLAISVGYKTEDIYEMTVREFTKALSKVDDLINYSITKLAAMTGLVSLPKGKKLEHWIYKPDKDMYGDEYKSLQSAQADQAMVS